MPFVCCRYVLAGGNLTCFAYGQTGSGKTYTMTAITSLVMDNLFSAGEFGLDSPLLIVVVCALSKQQRLSVGAPGDEDEPLLGTSLFASVSFYEIYMGKVYDLLNNRAQLKVLEDSKVRKHAHSSHFFPLLPMLK